MPKCTPSDGLHGVKNLITYRTSEMILGDEVLHRWTHLFGLGAGPRGRNDVQQRRGSRETLALWLRRVASRGLVKSLYWNQTQKYVLSTLVRIIPIYFLLTHLALTVENIQNKCL